VYEEWRARLGGGAVLWRRVDPGAPVTHRILPDGCVDLIWLAGALVVAGPDTRAHLTPGVPGATYVGLRFAPGTGPAVLGVPAHALRDRRVPLADLWPDALVRRLTAQLAEAVQADEGATATVPPPAARSAGALLEAAALPRLAAAPPEPALAAVARLMRAGTGVAATADAVGLSERQLRRRCLDAFGYGPKMLGRILRMRRALVLARSGAAFGAVAADAGYADQAHLAREVRALAGVPLGTLIT
jgi:AraC-like DNA-binding protein